MDKLFKDSEVYTEKRPTKITDAQRQKYFEEVAEEIKGNGWSTSTIERIVQDLSEISPNDNGYQAAKKLESWPCKGSYSIDAMAVEFLDCFNSNKDDILTENIKVWVKAHNIKPKLPFGTKLIIEKTLNHLLPTQMEIYITGMQLEEAYYMVSEDKNKNGGYCVDYEIIESHCKII